MRTTLLAALCCALMMPGCRLDSDGRIRGASQTSPAKKASPPSPAKKAKPAPEKPAAGLGGPPPTAEVAASKPACPRLSTAVYEALARPAALPERGAHLDDVKVKGWVGALEEQIKALKTHLSDTATKYNSCAGQAITQ